MNIIPGNYDNNNNSNDDVTNKRTKCKKTLNHNITTWTKKFYAIIVNLQHADSFWCAGTNGPIRLIT